MKVHSGASWRGYKRMSDALSRDFIEFDDAAIVDSDDEDADRVNIGRYDPALLYVQPSLKNGLIGELEVQMPRLPTRYMLRKEEIEICKEYDGFNIDEDGLGANRDFYSVLKAALERYAHLVSELAVVVIQLMGDGFRMNRCGKYVNFVLRVCGVHKLSGNHTSCETLAIWKGDDSYEGMRERVAPQFAAASTLAKSKAFAIEWPMESNGGCGSGSGGGGNGGSGSGGGGNGGGRDNGGGGSGGGGGGAMVGVAVVVVGVETMVGVGGIDETQRGHRPKQEKNVGVGRKRWPSSARGKGNREQRRLFILLVVVPRRQSK
jgi:hypothetical protein